MVRQSEHDAARLWREKMGLTREQLSERIGYSTSMIRDFEAGAIRGRNTPIGEPEWRRYKLACAAIDAGLEFNWGRK